MLKRHQILLASAVMAFANLSHAQANDPAQPATSGAMTPAPAASANTSSQAQDPYVQRREAKAQAKSEYKAAKKEAKQVKKQAKQEYQADKREANAQLKAATQSGSSAPAEGSLSSGAGR
jgi:hypothetical protein